MTDKLTRCAHCDLDLKTPLALRKHLQGEACGEVLDQAKITRPRVFSQVVDVPDPSKEQAKARAQAAVYINKDGNHSNLVLRRDKETVTYFPHPAQDGLILTTVKVTDFDRYHTIVADYPPGRAAKLYVGFALQIGGTEEAFEALSTLIDITPEEITMATARLATAKTAPAPKTAPPPKTAPAAKTATTKAAGPKLTAVPTPPKATAAKTAPAAKGPSAASRFKELIMGGKQTDDQIFAVVQKEFELDDSKRSYVAWYRNSLKKAGQNPPVPKD